METVRSTQRKARRELGVTETVEGGAEKAEGEIKVSGQPYEHIPKEFVS